MIVRAAGRRPNHLINKMLSTIIVILIVMIVIKSKNDIIIIMMKIMLVIVIPKLVDALARLVHVFFLIRVHSHSMPH